MDPWNTLMRTRVRVGSSYATDSDANARRFLRISRASCHIYAHRPIDQSFRYLHRSIPCGLPCSPCRQTDNISAFSLRRFQPPLALNTHTSISSENVERIEKKLENYPQSSIDDRVTVLKRIHTATRSTTKLSCLCRVRFSGVNWIPDNSRLSPTENLKSEHVHSNRPAHTGIPDTTRTGPSCRVWCGGVN